MGAVAVDEAEPALLVTKQDEVAAHEPDGLERAARHLVEFVNQRRRLPIAAEQAADRCTTLDARDQPVLFLAHHGGGLLVALDQPSVPPADPAGKQADQRGRNFGTVADSVTSSKTTSTGISQRTSSGGMPMTFEIMRGPSSSSTRATT